MPRYRHLRNLCRTIDSCVICAALSAFASFVSNYRQLRNLCRAIGICVICAELSAFAWFVPNYRQLRDFCRTIDSCVICVELSTFARFGSNYRQLRDLCRTIDSCVICAELSIVTWFVANHRPNQPSSCFLPTQHNIQLLVDARLMFLELQASIVLSNLKASERVSMFEQERYYSWIHRKREILFCGIT